MAGAADAAPRPRTRRRPLRCGEVLHPRSGDAGHDRGQGFRAGGHGGVRRRRERGERGVGRQDPLSRGPERERLSAERVGGASNAHDDGPDAQGRREAAVDVISGLILTVVPPDTITLPFFRSRSWMWTSRYSAVIPGLPGGSSIRNVWSAVKCRLISVLPAWNGSQSAESSDLVSSPHSHSMAGQ